MLLIQRIWNYYYCLGVRNFSVLEFSGVFLIVMSPLVNFLLTCKELYVKNCQAGERVTEQWVEVSQRRRNPADSG